MYLCIDAIEGWFPWKTREIFESKHREHVHTIPVDAEPFYRVAWKGGESDKPFFQKISQKQHGFLSQQGKIPKE